MNMLSFYGGPAGKDFTIAKIFPNKTAMDADIALGKDSPIYAGDYVLISYGDPNQPEFAANLTADGDTSYNATLWKKEWDNGYSYKEIVSVASSYPKFMAGNIESSLKFGEAPQLTIDSSSLASPKVGLKMPASLRAGTANTTESVAPTATASITPVYGGTLGNELSFQAKIPQGVTFTPSVSDAGEISWTNNGKLDNPVTVNIKGPKGDIGDQGPAGVADISLSVTGATVGQIAKITAVDDSGKPTAWEAVDMPSGGGDTLLYHYDTSEDAIITSTAIMPNLDISTTALLLFKWHINGYGTAEFGGRLMINNQPITKYFPYIHRKAGGTVDIFCVVAVLDASLTVIKFIADSNYFTDSADFVYEKGDSGTANIINIPNSGIIESFGIQGATVSGTIPSDKGENLDYTTSGFSVDVYKVV